MTVWQTGLCGAGVYLAIHYTLFFASMFSSSVGMQWTKQAIAQVIGVGFASGVLAHLIWHIG